MLGGMAGLIQLVLCLPLQHDEIAKIMLFGTVRLV